MAGLLEQFTRFEQVREPFLLHEPSGGQNQWRLLRARPVPGGLEPFEVDAVVNQPHFREQGPFAEVATLRALRGQYFGEILKVGGTAGHDGRSLLNSLDEGSL